MQFNYNCYMITSGYQGLELCYEHQKDYYHYHKRTAASLHLWVLVWTIQLKGSNALLPKVQWLIKTG